MNNEQVRVKCTGMDEEGKGIVKIKGKEVHIPNLLHGETAIVEISERRGSITAKVLQIEEKSKDRAIPKCPYFISAEAVNCSICHTRHRENLNRRESRS